MFLKVAINKLNFESFQNWRVHSSVRRMVLRDHEKYLVCKCTGYKAMKATLKTARRGSKGSHFFEEPIEETMERRRAQMPQLKKERAQRKNCTLLLQ